MSVAASDLQRYGSASRPSDDSSTSGGGIDTAAHPEVSQMGATDTVDVVSDGTDSRDVTITGRDASGAIVTETITLNGTNAQTSSTTFERVIKVELSASDGSRTVTVSETTSGDTIATLGPNFTEAAAHFRRSSSESSQTTRYEKDFWKNENGSSALEQAELTLTADPAAVIQQGIEDAKGDSSSVADRTTAPSGVTFVDDGVAQSVPGGSLGAGEAIGVWWEMTLAADANPVHDTFTSQISGVTA